MIVFRLAADQYKNDLSGKGAEIAGGRWNSKGVAVLYTSSNRALCMAEVLVHLPSGKQLCNFWIITIEVPDQAPLFSVNIKDLPTDWKIFPAPPQLAAIGDFFVKENNYLGLIVPSAVVPGENNLLLNPKHIDFQKVTIIETELFEFDSRLLK